MGSGSRTQEKTAFFESRRPCKQAGLLGASRANTDRCEVEASKMSTEPTKPESDHSVSKDEEVEIISEGTFDGTRKKLVEVEKGERVPDDTGDQGGAQN
jgi:hypothetical protein